MHKALRPSSVIPPGFTIVSSSVADDGATILVRSISATSQCPSCGSVSSRVHSRYHRQISDLPLVGRAVKLMADVRRFRCQAVRCGQSVFAERFANGVVAPWARRTGRLETLVHHLGLALGGRPAASFARRLMLPVSNDTLLRVVRRRGCPPSPAPTVIGIDDWAWRRNQRYGTIICDLERRRPISLLPDREPATAQAWLAEQPQVAIIARDRGGAYARAAAKALPNAVQVADRWHLMENASRAFLDAVRRSMRQIRSAIGTMTIKPELLTAAERLQYEGYLHREETNAVILGLSKAGVAIKEIVRRTGHSRGTVRRVLRGERSDVFRTRETSLEAYLPWLDLQWAAGSHNGAALWRSLQVQGFRGSLRVVTEWATRRRRAEKIDADTLHRVPSARTIARLMTIDRNDLSKAETLTVAAVESGVPSLVDARNIIEGFQVMIHRKVGADLDPWIARAHGSLVASFANGVAKDIAAVRAAIVSRWSNGQTEGQITKLKLVKRQMYGRGKLDLLQARLIGAT